jgi:hypothetical protein
MANLPNLLSQALRAIPSYPTQYFKFLGYTTDAQGLQVISYAPAVDLQAVVEPLEVKLYDYYGLDKNKRHYRIWIIGEFVLEQTAESTDKFIYNGKIYIVIASMQWNHYNGWTEGVITEQANV